MTTRAQQESIGRLETLRGRGDFAAAQTALEAGHPLLSTMGIDTTSALEALDMSASQLESAGIPASQLEAIVRTVTRPPMIIENGAVTLLGLPEADFGVKNEIYGKIRLSEQWLASVGRVEFINHAMQWGGTAWAIKEEADHFLVATNRHVAREVARRNHRGEGVYMRSPFTMTRYGALVDFNEEFDALPSDARPADIVRFTYLADDASADVAIGRIEKPDGFEVQALPLADGDVKEKELVAVIGYPAFDSRNDRTEMEQYFRGLYDVKRFSAGFAMKAVDGQIFTHDCTTLGGNSGSPVFSLERQVVVGLHFAGAYGVENSAVRVSTLKALLAGERTPQIQVGEAVFNESADGTHEPDYFEGRKGYDKDFLSAEVSFPTLPDGMFDLATPSDSDPARPHELRYTNFGLVFDRSRKSPVVTAVNMDGEKAIKIKRKRPDKWFFDKRIELDRQLGKNDFPGDLDRGHMVRREDPNWGESRDVAQLANDDTFHYTNASLQHLALNRNRKTWQGLENHILNSTKTHDFRATVFTGPLFDDDEDPVPEDLGIPIPLQYWKVVVMDAIQDDGTKHLHATAYLLSQGQAIQKYLQQKQQNEAVEGFIFGAYKTFQVSIAFLEELSGFDWSDALRAADPLAVQAEGLELETSWHPFIELESESQMVI